MGPRFAFVPCTHGSREALQLYSEVSLDGLPLDEVELHALLEKAENDALSAFGGRRGLEGR